MGGLAVARMSGEAKLKSPRVIPKGKWPLLLAVPDEALPTEEARRVLPSEYSRADAVTNVQNSMLLLAAFVQGRRDLLASALEDRMHQPYRAALCPLLPALQKLAADTPGILGAVLSGAGPSVLIFLDEKRTDEKGKAPKGKRRKSERRARRCGGGCLSSGARTQGRTDRSTAIHQPRSGPRQGLDQTTLLTATAFLSVRQPIRRHQRKKMLLKT